MSASPISGCGKGGRLTVEDVNRRTPPSPGRRAAAPKDFHCAAAPLPRVAGAREKQRVPMTRIRQRIAERLLEAKNSTAMLTTFNEVDLKAVSELRARYKDQFEKAHGVKLGFMSFFVKAAVEALKKYPVLNASVDGQRRDLPRLLRHRRRGVLRPRPGGADPARCRPALDGRTSRRRSATSASRRAKANKLTHGRPHGRHVLHHQRRHVRLDDVDADPQPSAVGDPGHARHHRAPDGRSTARSWSAR